MIYACSPENFNPKLTVVACFIEHGNQVFFLHRSPAISQGGTWAIPGGKLDDGESLEHAIKREVFEETNIKLQTPELLKTVYIRYDNYDYIYHMFREVFENKPEILLCPIESQDYAWLTRAEANALEAKNMLIQDEMPCIETIYKNSEFGEVQLTNV